MGARDAIIQVLDAPLSDDLRRGVAEAVAQKRWYFGNASVVGEEPASLLYYPMTEWHPDWGGETVFHRTNGEIVLAVLPKPKRAILFDARIPHEGRAPSRRYGGLRVTIAFKLALTGESQ